MSKKSERNKMEKRGEGIKAYFVRLFGKYDFRNERHFLYFVKWLSFILLMTVETVILLEGIGEALLSKKWGNFILTAGVVGALTLSMALHLFIVKGIKGKMPFYVFDFISACAFLFFVDGVYPFMLYVLILTQLYFEMNDGKRSFGVLAISIVVYILVYGVKTYGRHGAFSWDLFSLITASVEFLAGIAAHFVITQIILAFYRQYLKLHKTLQELEESKKELEKAYAVAKEVSALEERQRIAKEMHDTVGHSLTTVIMQTESAKRIMETDPKEAESKLISANLRARQALEEIRSGVHLLSGSSAQETLKTSLLNIVHESTDGTGITIRTDVDDITLPPAHCRFLCNSLKEGISNGLRHGGATAFWFELKESEGRVSFLLSDNGRGADGAVSLGFGLKTMAERARALGGELTYFTEEGEGFELRLTLEGEKNE